MATDDVRPPRRRPKRLRAKPKPPLSVPQILAWADAFFERKRRWPFVLDGRIREAAEETWQSVDNALRAGYRGLTSGSSLRRLLSEHRGARNRKALPPHSIARILAWADAYQARTGRWPNQNAGPVAEAPGETWQGIDNALHSGIRGLPGGSSLVRLFSSHRGVRNRMALPPHTVERILAWADAHRLRTGRWPSDNAGPVVDAPGETWHGIADALRTGVRGLPGGSSLSKLLAEQRGVRNSKNLERLTIGRILAWADAHHRRTGNWPKRHHGPISESAGDDWRAIDACLLRGTRGLPSGQSLAQLLNQRRGARNHKALPRYTLRQILAWADAHHRRTGAWPKARSGPILDAPGETWLAVNTALELGGRGLPGGDSLPRLLWRRRGVRHQRFLPRFSATRILSLARAHRRRTGKLPTKDSGPIADSPGDTWKAVDFALRQGLRGLPGGSSLAKLLKSRKITKTATSARY